MNPCPKFIEGTDECENVNECDLNDDLCLARGQFCSDTEGSYECLCDSGYEQRNYDLACIDINECAGGISNPFSFYIRGTTLDSIIWALIYTH